MSVFDWLTDTTGFRCRWCCGDFGDGLGHLIIVADLAIFLIYVLNPLILLYCVWSQPDLPFRSVFVLFAAFICLCGLTHLVDATMFFFPLYRLLCVTKVMAAIVAIYTGWKLLPILPRVLRLRSQESMQIEIDKANTAEMELKLEIEAKSEIERSLRSANNSLYQQILARTELEAEIAVLKQRLNDDSHTSRTQRAVERIDQAVDNIQGYLPTNDQDGDVD